MPRLYLDGSLAQGFGSSTGFWNTKLSVMEKICLLEHLPQRFHLADAIQHILHTR